MFHNYIVKIFNSIKNVNTFYSQKNKIIDRWIFHNFIDVTEFWILNILDEFFIKCRNNLVTHLQNQNIYLQYKKS